MGLDLANGQLLFSSLLLPYKRCHMTSSIITHNVSRIDIIICLSSHTITFRVTIHCYDIIGNNIIHYVLLVLIMALCEAICIPATAICNWARGNGPSVVLGIIVTLTYWIYTSYITDNIVTPILNFLRLTCNCFLTFYCDSYFLSQIWIFYILLPFTSGKFWPVGYFKPDN